MSKSKIDDTSSDQKPESDSGLIKGMLVVELKTGKQMRIREVVPNGIVCVKDHIYEDIYSPSEIMEFDEWVAKNQK